MSVAAVSSAVVYCSGAEKPLLPKAASSRGVFLLCHNNAGEVHGTIHIAFKVLPDGRVVHIAAVENTTGSDQLANCLANTIAAWSFPPHTGEPSEFVRPFNYD